ncbi:MAG: response regulator transcription factor [Bacteroidales bacterium]|nr:response regulator transcription factor [Bacteroidales bacterium]
MTKNILVVDDEADLCEILKFNLEHEGYTVDTAGSAEEALALLQKRSYHLILLDIMMGGMSGFKMVELLRKEWKDETPIIFLTARDTENDMLTGFSVGADDYISKPFSIKEVIARVKAVIKRTEGIAALSEADTMKIKNMTIDLNAKQIYVDGRTVILTKTEFEILYYLAKNPEKVLSRDNILNVVWPNDTYVLERTVDVHITRLRKKLGDCGHWIKNRSGYGYCFDAEE